MSYTCILIERVPYSYSHIIGVMNDLDAAREYFNKNVKQRSEETKQELDYFENFVEVFSGMQKMCTFKFSTITRELENKTSRDGDVNLLRCLSLDR